VPTVVKLYLPEVLAHADPVSDVLFVFTLFDLPGHEPWNTWSICGVLLFTLSSLMLLALVGVFFVKPVLQAIFDDPHVRANQGAYLRRAALFTPIVSLLAFLMPGALEGEWVGEAGAAPVPFRDYVQEKKRLISFFFRGLEDLPQLVLAITYSLHFGVSLASAASIALSLAAASMDVWWLFKVYVPAHRAATATAPATPAAAPPGPLPVAIGVAAGVAAHADAVMVLAV
jgi:hypothetical protein